MNKTIYVGTEKAWSDFNQSCKKVLDQDNNQLSMSGAIHLLMNAMEADPHKTKELLIKIKNGLI